MQSNIHLHGEKWNAEYDIVSPLPIRIHDDSNSCLSGSVVHSGIYPSPIQLSGISLQYNFDRIWRTFTTDTTFPTMSQHPDF